MSTGWHDAGTDRFFNLEGDLELWPPGGSEGDRTPGPSPTARGRRALPRSE